MTLSSATEHARLSLNELIASDPHGGREAGRERRYLCPFCHGDRRRDAAHRSLSVNVETGMWHCHRCEQGGKLAEWHAASGVSRRGRAPARLTGNLCTPRPERLSEELRRALGRVRPLEGIGAAYLQGRGVTLALCEDVRFAPSWDGIGPAVVFLVRGAEGVVVAAQGRACGGREMRSVGPVTRGVFATPGALEADPVGITEAPIDALSLASVGLPALALLGSRIGADRAPLLRKLLAKKMVLIATDRYDAGERAATEVQSRLTIGTEYRRLEIPPPWKDVNEWLCADRQGLTEAVERFRVETLLGYATRRIG